MKLKDRINYFLNAKTIASRIEGLEKELKTQREVNDDSIAVILAELRSKALEYGWQLKDFKFENRRITLHIRCDSLSVWTGMTSSVIYFLASHGFYLSSFNDREGKYFFDMRKEKL